MEQAVAVGVTAYNHDLNYLLSLDIFAFDRLLEISRKVRNSDMVEQANVIRAAVNADAKEFKKFLEYFSNETAEEREAAKIAESVGKLEKLFGG